jgi:ACT domain-containing protein
MFNMTQETKYNLNIQEICSLKISRYKFYKYNNLTHTVHELMLRGKFIFRVLKP